MIDSSGKCPAFIKAELELTSAKCLHGWEAKAKFGKNL